MGKVVVNITNKRKIFVDANGKTYETFRDLQNSKSNNTRMVKPTSEEERREEEDGEN